MTAAADPPGPPPGGPGGADLTALIGDLGRPLIGLLTTLSGAAVSLLRTMLAAEYARGRHDALVEAGRLAGGDGRAEPQAALTVDQAVRIRRQRDWMA